MPKVIFGDDELLLRYFLEENISYQYLDIDKLVMSLGGASNRNLFSILCYNSLELIKACQVNGTYINWFMFLYRFCLKVWGVFKWLFIPNYIKKNDI